MELPNLDEITKKALNELTIEKGSCAYEHEIIWYGIDAVAHVHLMRMAKDISKGRLSKEKFIKKYELEFGNKNHSFGDWDHGFVVPLEKIESDGIFIPRQAYLNAEGERFDRKVWFFNRDYCNVFLYNADKYPVRLIEKKWQPSDFENSELIEQGIKFGKDMWEICVKRFEEYKGKPKERVTYSYKNRGAILDWFLPRKQVRTVEMIVQPQKVTELGEKLIAYYSALIYGPTP